jgi:hypothetical protein
MAGNHYDGEIEQMIPHGITFASCRVDPQNNPDGKQRRCQREYSNRPIHLASFLLRPQE